MSAVGALRGAKLILRFLGAVVSVLFAAQAVWLFANPHVSDFWEGCHWLGQGILGLLAGLAGCYLEVKGGMSSVARHFTRLALNRIGLSIFYFWMGCYVMGGMGVLHTGEMWRSLAHATGIVAWAVSAGDLLVSCSSEGGGEEEQDLRASAAPATATKTVPGLQAPATAYGAGATYGGHGVSMGFSGREAGGGSGAAGAGAGSPFEGGADFEDVSLQETPPAAALEGGWNSGPSKPFGCA